MLIIPICLDQKRSTETHVKTFLLLNIRVCQLSDCFLGSFWLKEVVKKLSQSFNNFSPENLSWPKSYEKVSKVKNDFFK